MTDTTEATRDRIAQETAEYIAGVLTPKSATVHAEPNVNVFYVSSERPPTAVADFKATLLDGRFWISWTDEVTAAMRAIHSQPSPPSRTAPRRCGPKRSP
ncbi:head-tail adaptor [Streptacidiphilus sp. MAP12-16]|uniref:hypothetical protein n=1 Tax=Streptacidiphilus sp. MAP12-16 TaxID=3156300 RepID=UPI00351141F8